MSRTREAPSCRRPLASGSLLLAVVAGAFLLAACGSSAPADQTDESGSQPTQPTQPPPAQRAGGIFASIGIPNSPIDDTVIDLPFVAGFVTRTTWADVEPEEGTFNWSFIDEQLARAEDKGKKIILRVTAGANAPSWVYDKGAASLPIPSHPRNMSMRLPDPPRVPLPWDAIMVAEWHKFVAALGERYDGHPSIYFVSMAGPTFYHNEMILPRYMKWEKAGYTEEKIIEAWKATLDAYGEAFLHTPFSIAVNPIAVLDRPGSVEPAKQVVSYGLSRFGSRFFVQANWLSDIFPKTGTGNPTEQLYQLIAESSHRTTVGFQVGGKHLSGLTLEPEELSSPEELASDIGLTVVRALEVGASYVEIGHGAFDREQVMRDLTRLAPLFEGQAQTQ